MMQTDTVWDAKRDSYTLKQNIFKTFPESETPVTTSNDSLIVKKAGFATNTMSGAILLGFNTDGIEASKAKIKMTSIIVSGIVLLVGFLLGFWLARNISIPVLALRDAARKVGEGDLNQKIKYIRQDEIGQLGNAFNKMIDDLEKTTDDLNEKNLVLSATNSTLNDTLEELKKTHVQLVQSEKMASLGELTAGIAHEIQNPLNFVNNFSEINTELIDELVEEIKSGNIEEAEAIASDIRDNETKIMHHGKRADAIVKGMLQHSRSSTGKKEPTDINALCDEYLRLSYHGLRAKDKTFNATMKTDFDTTIGQINVISQDVGRVILNLLTNAFYAVNEKKHRNIQGYEPTVSVTTKKFGDKIEIKISDNADGIPQAIREKIFQPFFTTKPTGKGTGLGLSLSYDIIVKGHDGELKVDSVEGEGTTFTINLNA